MGLRKMVKGLTKSMEELEQERLTGRFADLDLGQAALAECPLRERVRVSGEIKGLRVVPRAGSPWLEAVVDDGTGSAVALFTGRRRIRGLDPGRAVVLEGVARKDRGRILMMNPTYTLLP
jgi:hypothetical protein